MYGEHYGNSTGFGPSPPLLYPKIVVYTSPDLSAWTFRGFALNSWPNQPFGTFFTPWVVYNKQTSEFVLWFNAYLEVWLCMHACDVHDVSVYASVC